jgi:hypothetical protein
MNDLDMERAVEPLRTAAAGVYANEAAVELLIEHGTWLYRADFRARFVNEYQPDPDDVMYDVALAEVRWADAVAALNAGELPCSTSEAHMLRIAASIADGVPVDLRRCLGNLDGRNLRLVLGAIVHANGYRGAEVSIA